MSVLNKMLTLPWRPNELFIVGLQKTSFILMTWWVSCQHHISPSSKGHWLGCGKLCSSGSHYTLVTLQTYQSYVSRPTCVSVCCVSLCYVSLCYLTLVCYWVKGTRRVLVSWLSVFCLFNSDHPSPTSSVYKLFTPTGSDYRSRTITTLDRTRCHSIRV